MSTRLEAGLPTDEAATAVRRSAGFAVLDDASGWPFSLVEVVGQDAGKFLQNQTTNDVGKLEPGKGQLSAAVDRQGKIQGVFSLHQQHEVIYRLLTDSDPAALKEHLEKFHIMEELTVADRSAEVSILTLQGPQAEDILAAAFEPELPAMSEYDLVSGRWLDVSVAVVKRSLTGEPGYCLWLGRQDLEILLERLGHLSQAFELVAIPPEALEVLRVEAGIPRFGRDYDSGVMLPETGFEQSAVSYDKGCYLGQEVIARVKTYGSVQRHLVGLTSETPLPLGDVSESGKPIGKVTSVVEKSPTLDCPVALAYLDKSHRAPDASWEVQAGGWSGRVSVTLLPFVKSKGSGQEAGALLDSGLKAFSEGRDEESVAMLRQAIELDSDRVDAYEALGAILYRQARQNGADTDQADALVDEAIDLMNRVLALDPDHVMAHTNLSIYWLHKGDKDKAEEEKAKATVAGMKKKAREAGLDFGKLEEERKKAEEAKREQLEERIDLFVDALKYNPDDPLGNFGLGSAYLELQRYEEAIEPLKKTIEAQPKHSVAYLSLGKALEGANRRDEAREYYARGIEAASARGDMMPLEEMRQRLGRLS